MGSSIMTTTVSLHRKLVAFGALCILLSRLLVYHLNDPCLVGSHRCDPQSSKTVVDKFPIESTRGSIITKVEQTQTKALLNQILLPEQPDSQVVENLKKRIRVDAELVDIFPLVNCSATSQVRILQYSDDSWKLVSLDKNGNNKMMGGDEYYVTYTDASSRNVMLVAFDHDNGDGTYDLDFSTTPMNLVNISGYGTVTVHLDYTCGVGAMGQPLKDKWRSGAACGTRWIRQNVTTPLHRIFAPPTDIGIDWSAYNTVIGFGDSLIEGFFKAHGVPDALKILYRPNTTAYGGSPSMELNSKTVDLLMDKLREKDGRFLNQTNVALVIGSSVWDLLSKDTVDPDFVSHLQGARRFVEQLQLEYPNIPLYWKSASAMQPHTISSLCLRKRFINCRHRTRYMSNSRAQILYEKQKELMSELGIPFLDLWEAYYLSGDKMEASDGRHYNNEINRLMQSWFYRGG
jgi:lysophospholipase L1-like esterase